jgi:hypothetical protein
LSDATIAKQLLLNKNGYDYNKNMFIFEILKKIGAFFLDLIETVVIALAIFVVVYLFLV